MASFRAQVGDYVTVEDMPFIGVVGRVTQVWRRWGVIGRRCYRVALTKGDAFGAIEVKVTNLAPCVPAPLPE